MVSYKLVFFRNPYHHFIFRVLMVSLHWIWQYPQVQYGENEQGFLFFYIQWLTKCDLYTSPNEQTGLLRINGSLSDDFRKKEVFYCKDRKKIVWIRRNRQIKEVVVSLFLILCWRLQNIFTLYVIYSLALVRFGKS